MLQLILRPRVNRPVLLGARPHLGTHDQILNFLMSHNYFLLHVHRNTNCRPVCSLYCGDTLVRVAQTPWPYITVSSETPQPGGPGPRNYIPKEQGGPSYTPGTGLPLRLTGLRWRYSNPSPHGESFFWILEISRYLCHSNLRLTNQRTFHWQTQQLLLLLVIATAPSYTSSSRTAQKTLFFWFSSPLLIWFIRKHISRTAPLFLRAWMLRRLHSNDRSSQCLYLATAVI
jgi:hypothetical protein